MKPFYLNDDFKTLIPDSWSIQQDENQVSIHDRQHGLGALQFSYYLVTDINSIILSDELKDYLKDIYENANPLTSNNIAYFNITDNNSRYWRYWLLKGSNSIIFISYNCDATDMGKEDEIVNTIVRDRF